MSRRRARRLSPLGKAKKDFKKYLAVKAEEFDKADIDRCGYFEPSDPDDIQCENIGVALQLTDSVGQKMIQYRCEEHGWEPGKTKLHLERYLCTCSDAETTPIGERDKMWRGNKCANCGGWVSEERIERMIRKTKP